MKSFRSTAAALALGLAFSVLTVQKVQAGITISQTWLKLDGKSEPAPASIRFEKDLIRLEMGSTKDMYFIYRGDKKLFWIVNLKDKSYTEMTEKDFEDMLAKMEQAKKQMAAQMEKMPPEQRKMMEDMMKKMPGADAPKTEFKSTGSGGIINGWNTVKYEAIREGAKRSDIWLADFKAVGVSEADFAPFRHMAKYFEKFSPDSEWKLQDKGMPVKTITYKEGKPEFQTEVKSVKQELQPPALFEVPAGFALKKMAGQSK
jgi:uncharacterized protein DUF4412